MDVQKDSPSAAGKTSFCSTSSKAHPNFFKAFVRQNRAFLQCFHIFFAVGVFLLMPAALVVGIFWEVVSVSPTWGVPLAISHSRPSIYHSILKKRG